jgi:hypothetical protein
VQFQQDDASIQFSTTVVWAESSTGNELSHKHTTNGVLVTWNTTPAATYAFKAVRFGAKNCNGISFGHGNYTLYYDIYYLLD